MFRSKGESNALPESKFFIVTVLILIVGIALRRLERVRRCRLEPDLTGAVSHG